MTTETQTLQEPLGSKIQKLLVSKGWTLEAIQTSERTPDTAMVLWYRSLGEFGTEYATHEYWDVDESFFWGHYFRDDREAAHRDFDSRCKRLWERNS